MSRRADPSSRSSPIPRSCRAHSSRGALRRVPDPGARLAAMAAVGDFAGTAFLAGVGPAEQENGDASLRLRESGADLVVEAAVSSRAFVATSLPDWPGWTAESDGRALPLEAVNHAFVGFWLEPGRHAVRLTYRPVSWALGLASFSAGSVICVALALAAARTASGLTRRIGATSAPAAA